MCIKITPLEMEIVFTIKCVFSETAIKNGTYTYRWCTIIYFKPDPTIIILSRWYITFAPIRHYNCKSRKIRLKWIFEENITYHDTLLCSKLSNRMHDTISDSSFGFSTWPRRIYGVYNIYNILCRVYRGVVTVLHVVKRQLSAKCTQHYSRQKKCVLFHIIICRVYKTTIHDFRQRVVRNGRIIRQTP